MQEVDATAADRMRDAEVLAAARQDALHERLQRRLQDNWAARSGGAARRLAGLRNDKARSRSARCRPARAAGWLLTVVTTSRTAEAAGLPGRRGGRHLSEDPQSPGQA